MTDRDWYSPGEIRFKSHQVLWLILHSPEYAPDKWPPEHKETGYIDSKSRGKADNATIVWAELRQRIESCGDDGIWLELAYSKSNYSPMDQAQHIANSKRLQYETVVRRIIYALRYICGKCPRWINCPGVGKCVECKSCPRLRDKKTGEIKCQRKPREGRTYKAFREHKRRDKHD